MLYKKLANIPTNLVMGFLGVGKTTAILNLLENKPKYENWAVLVNEFGSVGIDGAIYATKGVFVKEVPGGCMCCAVGIPMQVAVNHLLKEAKPDRLLIEPSGLGHPRRILETLSADSFKNVLNILASICLVDPRKLNDTRYTGNENFVDQIALADVLVANKVDLSDSDALQQFDRLGSISVPGKTVVAKTTQGRIKTEWLDLPKNPDRKSVFPLAHENSQSYKQNQVNVENPVTYQRLENSDAGFYSCGWVFPKATVFNFQSLHDWLHQVAPERMKGVFLTEQGWHVFNCSDGLVTVTSINNSSDSRVEFIVPWEQKGDFETGLTACIQS